MTDAIEGDVRAVSEVQGRLSELAEKMDTSQKAMVTLRKIHRAMCMSKDRVSQ
jgi:predicted transcriptional regulator